MTSLGKLRREKVSLFAVLRITLGTFLGKVAQLFDCGFTFSFIGRDGLTHNMLDVIHNHWKHAEAVRIKCMGVPTVDMKNICAQLEVFSFFHLTSVAALLLLR